MAANAAWLACAVIAFTISRAAVRSGLIGEAELARPDQPRTAVAHTHEFGLPQKA
ncbi:hypothetical protein [Xylanimonas sp. McL0601]|uniref:hypothetical protein n=1 Tax=Xylanimonas sp. McL0601 TaxID=3414739 RepID=UPI003CF71579